MDIQKGIQAYFATISKAAMRFIHESEEYPQQDRHRELARGVGSSLYVYGQAGYDAINASYSAVYVIACDLKPKLDADEWIHCAREGFRLMEEYYKENHRNMED